MQKIIFTILFIGFFSCSIKAQNNRRYDPNTNPTTTQKQAAIDPIESTMSYLKKELSLDSFQEAAIKIYVKENYEDTDKIRFSDLPDSGKKAQMEKIIKIFDEKVIKILNPDQIKKYEQLQSERTNKKKKNNKKKDKELQE